MFLKSDQNNLSTIVNNDDYHFLPINLYNAETVREMDRIAIDEQGVPGFELMTKAARFSFHCLLKAWPKTQNIIVLTGRGNNGGDGYLVAKFAKRHKLNVHILYLATPDKLKGDALSAYHACISEGVHCVEFKRQTFLTLSSEPNTVIVDALLGTGLNTDVKGIMADAIAAANESTAPVLAIDIPSGLSADTGNVLGIAIKAQLTTTFIGLKTGLFTGSGRAYSGHIQFSALDLDSSFFSEIKPQACRLDLPSLLQELKPRARDSHKGQFGHTVLIGGDHAYGGAIILAACAALRMGSGLTTVITRSEHKSALLSHTPELMVSCSDNMDDILSVLNKANAIVIGPGLGQSAWSEKMLLAALQSGKPLVIDADALNLLTKNPLNTNQITEFKTKDYILTPHPGEAGRLLKCDTKTIQDNRIQAIKDLQETWGGHILLKGSGSLVLSADTPIYLSPYGNPGMASGGMGDVLSGLIGGLLAQTNNPSYALKLGVALHAKAADWCVAETGERGLLASDLIPKARMLLNAHST